MKIEVKIIASDGKECNSIQECILHEAATSPETFSKFNNGLVMYHRMGAPLNADESTIEETHDFFKAGAIMIFDKEKANLFFEGFRPTRVNIPDTNPGFYVLDIVSDTWKRVLDDNIGIIGAISRRYFEKM